MSEKEINEKTDDLIFSIEIENVLYEIYLDFTQEENMLPHGVVKTLGKDKEETSKFNVDVEEIIINIVKFFGYKGEVSKNEISYFIQENDKKKTEINFFGPFGSLKIDESDNVVYDTNP